MFIMVTPTVNLSRNLELALKACDHLGSRPSVATQQSREQIIVSVMETAQNGSGSFCRYLIERFVPLMTDDFNLRHPKYIGHMTRPTDPMLAALAVLVVYLNPNPVKTETARVVTEIERQRTAEWYELVFHGVIQ